MRSFLTLYLSIYLSIYLSSVLGTSVLGTNVRSSFSFSLSLTIYLSIYLSISSLSLRYRGYALARVYKKKCTCAPAFVCFTTAGESACSRRARPIHSRPAARTRVDRVRSSRGDVVVRLVTWRRVGIDVTLLGIVVTSRPVDHCGFAASGFHGPDGRVAGVSVSTTRTRVRARVAGPKPTRAPAR